MTAPGSVPGPDALGCRTAKVLYFEKFTSALCSDWTFGGVEAQFATLSMTPAALTLTQPAIAIRFTRSLSHFMRASLMQTTAYPTARCSRVEALFRNRR